MTYGYKDIFEKRFRKISERTVDWTEWPMYITQDAQDCTSSFGVMVLSDRSHDVTELKHVALLMAVQKPGDFYWFGSSSLF